MAQKSVAAPPQNYSDSEDLIFEIGDEEVEPKKRRGDDDHLGYGHEAEPIDEHPDAADDDDDDLEEFSGFDWADEDDIVE